jgi:hypothetical protein
MADYLVYWQSFWEDCGEKKRHGADWYTRDRDLYSKIRSGDALWIVANGGEHSHHEWRLLGKTVIEKRGESRSRTKWGRYELIGDASRCSSYSIGPQPDLAAILRLLQFESGRPIRLLGAKIGQAIQKYRPLSSRDTFILDEYARTLRKVRAV